MRISWKNAIDNLIELSLIKRKKLSDDEGRWLWMHPLVKLWVRECFSTEKDTYLATEISDIQIRRTEGALNAVLFVCSSLVKDLRDRKPTEWLYERKIMTHLEVC